MIPPHPPLVKRFGSKVKNLDRDVCYRASDARGRRFLTVPSMTLSRILMLPLLVLPAFPLAVVDEDRQPDVRHADVADAGRL